MDLRHKKYPDRQVVGYLLIMLYLIILAKSLFASHIGFSILDEGEYLHIGLRILRGDIPYRDFFSYLPPLYSYWNTLALKIFGIDVYSVRLLNSIVFSFVPVLIFLIASRFSNKTIAATVALAFAFMEVNMERLYYHIFTFSGLLLFILAFKNHKYKQLFFSGLLFGITALFRLDIGLLFFIGLSIGVLIHSFKIPKLIILFSSAFAIPLLFLSAWLIKNNAVSQFLRSQLGTPAQITAKYALPFPLIWDLIPKNLTPQTLFHSYETYVIYVILFTYLFFIIHLSKNWRKIWSQNPEVVFLFIIGILTAPYMLGRTDLGHIIKGALPAFFIGAYLINISGSLQKWLLLIPVSFVVVGLGQVFWSNKFYNTPVKTINGTINLNKQWPAGTILIPAKTIEQALNFINLNTSNNDQIFVSPYMAGLYFLSDRPSKSYEGNILYSYVPNEDEFVESLESLNIKVVIYDPENGPQGPNLELKKLRNIYPKIDRYIMDNFKTMEKSPEGWLFMVQKHP
ncbi:MAG: hypothetical protein UR81_C0036G0005 [Candidatus Levybacteria bacterium GW2011_GWB1_35_5]|nr:MAG: hypothetical protein UR81_C0036G0005 [Candidatus Levybacteria bacterium GW2011_GWB1_35_5]